MNRARVAAIILGAFVCVGVPVAAFGQPPAIEQWTHHADAPVTSVAADRNGGVYALVSSATPVLLRLAENGAQLWARPITDLEWPGLLTLLNIASVPSGVVVAGVVAPPGFITGDTDVWLRLYDAQGSAVWERRFGGAAYDAALGVAVGPGGAIYVAGYVDAAAPTREGADAFIRKYDAAGNALWTFEFDHPTLASFANDVTVSEDGTVYIVGWGLRMAFDADGQILWAEGASALSHAAAGNGLSVYDAVHRLVSRYAADGTLRWSLEPDPATLNALAADAGGNTYAGGGWSFSVCKFTCFGSQGAAVSAYDADANRLWSGSWQGTFGTPLTVNSLDHDRNGALFVALRGVKKLLTNRVAIDINPGQPESIVDGTESIPVAILSAPGFDATTIKGPACFGSSRGQPTCTDSERRLEDVDRDGDLDLLLMLDLSTAEFGGLTLVPQWACVTGKMPDGTPFGGCDLVMIGERQPPVITSITPSITSIWPPDDRMVGVDIEVVATDATSPFSCVVTSISATSGTSADWEFEELWVSLRAARDGGGARTYTITVTCRDPYGNTSTATTSVVVPHDRRRSARL